MDKANEIIDAHAQLARGVDYYWLLAGGPDVADAAEYIVRAMERGARWQLVCGTLYLTMA